ncbi:hypothetical protein LCGC14_3128660, partial [marine sediment metagenome]
TDEAKTAIATHKSALAKSGLGIRPRKPTEEMVTAASEVVSPPGPQNHRHRKRRYWKAMWDKYPDKPDG